MAVGQKPFEGISAYQTKNKILNTDPLIPDFVDPGLKDLILRLLEKNPQKRLKTYEKVSNHPFFAGFSAEKPPTKPRLNFDSDTYYFDPEFTGMPLQADADFILNDLYTRENSPVSTSTQSSCCIKT